MSMSPVVGLSTLLSLSFSLYFLTVSTSEPLCGPYDEADVILFQDACVRATSTQGACKASDSASFNKLRLLGGCKRIYLAAPGELRIADTQVTEVTDATHLTAREVITALEGAELDITSGGTMHIVGPIEASPSRHALRFEVRQILHIPKFDSTPRSR